MRGGLVLHLRRMDGDKCYLKLWDEFVLWLGDFVSGVD